MFQFTRQERHDIPKKNLSVSIHAQKKARQKKNQRNGAYVYYSTFSNDLQAIPKKIPKNHAKTLATCKSPAFAGGPLRHQYFLKIGNIDLLRGLTIPYSKPYPNARVPRSQPRLTVSLPILQRYYLKNTKYKRSQSKCLLLIIT